MTKNALLKRGPRNSALPPQFGQCPKENVFFQLTPSLRHWYLLHWTKTKVLRSLEWYSICITHVVHFQKKIGAFSSFFFQSLHAWIPAALSTQEQSLFQVSENQARTTSGSSCFLVPRCRWWPQHQLQYEYHQHISHTLSRTGDHDRLCQAYTQHPAFWCKGRVSVTKEGKILTLPNVFNPPIEFT